MRGFEVGALLAAAAVTVLVAAAHSYLGERFILVRLFRRHDLPVLFGSDDFTKRTLRLAWHITSVAFLGYAALLVTLAVSGDASPIALARIVSLTYAASGAVALVVSRGRHLSWVAFFLTAALVWLAHC